MADISNDDLRILLDKVAALQTDKQDEDNKTQAAGDKHAELTKTQADAAAAVAKAQSDANNADAAEAAAQSKVGADLADLKAFVEGLVPDEPPSPTPPPGGGQ